MYRLNSPGNYLNTVDTWNEGLQKLGGENTAYWPNQVVPVPPEVRFITSTYFSPSMPQLKLDLALVSHWIETLSNFAAIMHLYFHDF